jgi:hypothetical protein
MIEVVAGEVDMENLEFENTVVQQVQNYWNLNRRPLLLSRIGDTNPALVKWLKSNGSALGAFINELAPKLKMIGTGGLTSAYPGHENIESAEIADSAIPRAVYPIYYSDLWNLFAYPRVGNAVKIVENGVTVITQGSLTSPLPEGVFAVEKEDFKTDPDSPMRQTPAEIAEAIKNWANKNSISIDKLVDSSPPPRSQKTERNNYFASTSRPISELLKFLNCLEASELSGMTLNGVFLQSLLRRSGIKGE